MGLSRKSCWQQPLSTQGKPVICDLMRIWAIGVHITVLCMLGTSWTSAKILQSICVTEEQVNRGINQNRARKARDNAASRITSVLTIQSDKHSRVPAQIQSLNLLPKVILIHESIPAFWLLQRQQGFLVAQLIRTNNVMGTPVWNILLQTNTSSK